MIQRFVDHFIAAKSDIEAALRGAHPESYDDLVKRVLAVLTTAPDPDYQRVPDPERLTIIDHGDYQGTRLYIVAATGYQPSTYWSIFVDYGSCSGCDSYERLRDYSNDAPTDEQVAGYWSMMLHMVQSMRQLRASDDD